MFNSYIYKVFLLFALVLLESCDNLKESNHGANNLMVLQNDTMESAVNKEKKYRKIFKTDSSQFSIVAREKSLSIKFDRNDSFDSQLQKLSESLHVISKEHNLSSIRQINIHPCNNELLSDIADVEEIQNELRIKKKNGVVNSIGIVSQYAGKSKKMESVTNLFSKYYLEPYNYYIDKCVPLKISDERLKLSMHCSTINFDLKEIVEKN